MKILFFCPINPERPTGGVLVIFRMVELLIRQGIDACIVNISNQREGLGHSIGWFESTAPVMGWTQACQLSAESCIFVVPEDYGMAWTQTQILTTKGALDLAKAHILVLAQNRQDMYRNLSAAWPTIPNRQQTILAHPKLLGVLCVSDLERNYWKLIYPDLQIWCKPNSVDTAHFKPNLVRENIAVFIAKPGRPLAEAQHLLIALRHSGLAADWRLENLQGKPQQKLAQAFARADLFLSLGTVESFGLAAAEAMASGCIVIGYHGGVPEEFFNPQWSYPVPPLNHMAYLHAFEQMNRDRKRCLNLFEEKRKLGRAHIERNFSPKQEAQAVANIFSEILSKANIQALTTGRL